MDTAKAIENAKLILNTTNPFIGLAGFPLLFLTAYFLSALLILLLKKSSKGLTANTVFTVVFGIGFIYIKSIGYHAYATQITIYFFLASFLFSLLYRYLKKITGLFLLIALVLGFLFFHGLTVNHKEKVIAKLKVVEIKKGKIQIDIKPVHTKAIASAKKYTLEGKRFAFIVYQIIYKDYLAYFGFEAGYRWLGIESSDGNFKQKDLILFPDVFEYKSILDILQKNEKYIPGIKTVQVLKVSKFAQEGDRFKLVLKVNGALLLVPED